MTEKIRYPRVAGQFYPRDKNDLVKQIESFLHFEAVKKDAIGCVLPHAGYVYSGTVACDVISRLKPKKEVIILGPNHTGKGENYSIMTEGSWATPFGKVNINSGLSEALLEKSKLLCNDALAHEFEHSIEVELPILQYYFKEFSFTPIAIKDNNIANFKKLGVDIASLIKESGRQKDILVIASSDMTHYEEAARAKVKDLEAIEAILELNEAKLWEKIHSLNITMCGYGPVIALLSCAKALNAKGGELVTYKTSGDVTKDYSSVVGYAGIIIS